MNGFSARDFPGQGGFIVNGQFKMTWDEQGNVTFGVAPTPLHERRTEALEKQLTLDTAIKTAIAKTDWCKDTRKDKP